ncbi:myo-inositol-1-phosphate synthase, partial [Streptomyces anthocyanicus]
ADGREGTPEAREERGRPVDVLGRHDAQPPVGDWKTAWDHIAFDGFLGARMFLQTTWQGCDSSLAAPLVLDLARLVARAHQRGLSGPLGELGFFFKDPVGDGPSALAEQYGELKRFAGRLREDADGAPVDGDGGEGGADGSAGQSGDAVAVRPGGRGVEGGAGR